MHAATRALAHEGAPRPGHRGTAGVATTVLLLLSGLASAPAAGPQGDLAASDGWARIGPELELRYPRDHGSHPEYRTEWWYATGNVVDASGSEFGFQFTIFRSGVVPGGANGLDETDAPAGSLRARHVFAAHLAVADVAGGKTHFAERMRRAGPLAAASETDMQLYVEDWELTRSEGGELRIRATDPLRGIGLDLTLDPARAPILHGDGGYSQKGADAGNASAYMSWTRLDTQGTLTVGGTPRAVGGSAWFDHEFGTSVLEAGVSGWDWFGLQFESGEELMLFTLRGARAAAAATWIGADGSVRVLAPDEFALTPKATWTSSVTGAAYPSVWQIDLRALGLKLEVRAALPDAELRTGGSTGVVYWEGPVRVSGDRRGRGYAELTGYAGSMGGRF